MVKVNVDVAYTVCWLTTMEWLNVNSGDGIDPLSMHTHDHVDPSLSSVRPACVSNVLLKHALNPLLSALPLWFRFLQCCCRYWHTHQRWPHIANAGKYAFAHSVVLFGIYNSSFQNEAIMTNTYKFAWIGCMILSTLYTFLWDVCMDWGLGVWRHRGLREQLLFPNRGVYYAAIVIDLFMRFAWTLTLIPQVMHTCQYDRDGCRLLVGSV